CFGSWAPESKWHSSTWPATGIPRSSPWSLPALLLLGALTPCPAPGAIRKLPLLRTVLSAITAIYIVRGVAFVPVMAYFPGNSMTFWVASSSICVLIGVVHLVGLRQSWGRLSGGAA